MFIEQLVYPKVVMLLHSEVIICPISQMSKQSMR